MAGNEVFFIKADEREGEDSVREKFKRLLDGADLFSFIRKGDDVAIKTHFGEDGNTGHIKPPYIKMVADKVIRQGGMPSVADSNALYRGRRTFTTDHLKLAAEHGFTKEAIGAPVVIAEGESGKDVVSVAVNKKYIKSARIAAYFRRADCIIATSHFKGHLISGFGGAIKNLGMGCASREGKLAQHSNISPYVEKEQCVSCGACAAICPVRAISIKDDKASIDPAKCIGCSECIATCAHGAISVAWNSGVDDVQEKMAEYALAALKGKRSKSLFINFAIRVRAECDCWPKDYPAISPDVGIFASHDPVAVDKASFDAVNKLCGKDVFRQAHPEIDSMKQLVHAGRIGLGSMDYDLVSIA